MTPPLSINLRERMVAWSQPPFSWSYRQIALVAGCSIGTVYNVLQLHREYGQVTNPLAEPTHKRHIVMDEADYKFVRGLVTAQPTLYLDEIQDRLFESRGTTASLASISRALKKLTITHKQVSKIAMERNELLQATWQGEIAQFLDNPSMFLFVDESAMNMHTALRRCGWSEAGSPCTQRQIFIRGQGFSVLPALSLDGVIALDIFQGAVNRERFIQFLRDHIVPLLNPFPQKHSIVVMDNCAIHHDAEIREIIENECGARLIYLPPYSPDFNPIEEAFSFIKAWIRRHSSEIEGKEGLPWLIYRATQAVTPEVCHGWFIDCGYM